MWCGPSERGSIERSGRLQNDVIRMKVSVEHAAGWSDAAPSGGPSRRSSTSMVPDENSL
jgi:hypothetical protein